METAGRVKILYVITLGILGGAQTHIRHLAIHIKDRAEVHVAMGVKGPLWHQLEELGVQVHQIPSLVREISPLKDLKAIREIVELMRKVQPDLVSTHSSKAGILGRLAARICSIPTIFTAHGWAFTEGVPERQRKVYTIAERVAASWAKKIICVSQHDRKIALECSIGNPQKVIAINNGMPQLLNMPLADTGKFPVRFAMVARFCEQKDHQLLLNAISQIRNSGLKVDFIGDGPLLEKSKDLAYRLGILESVTFLGPRTDVPNILPEYQGFLLISKWEGFPRSILEAMRAGLPVIASDVGGAREAVIDGKTGFLVPRGDVNGLVRYLERLARDGNLRSKMGQHGYERFNSLFTFDRMLEKTLQVYEMSIGKRDIFIG